VIDEPLAGPAKHHEFLEPDEPARFREQRGVVFREPAQFRDRQHRMHRRAGARVECRTVAVGTPSVGDRMGAPVHPGDDR
jgi:hypothetical protein